MNLLIVDDEYYSVENLRKKLDWAALGFGQVLCAYSMAQAQEIFAAHIVDVMLCDIEMPKGSGLDLLEWIRTRGYGTVCVFLTCFARFDYASRAIRLESSDYLLKPVEADELRAAVEKAVEKKRHAEAEQLNELHAEYWQDSATQRTERFWKEAAEGAAATPEGLAQALEELHLPAIAPEQTFLPVLLDCRATGAALEWKPGVYEYALKNILNEMLYQAHGLPPIAALGGLQYFLPLCCTAAERAAAAESCRVALKACRSTLPGCFRFYLAGLCTLPQIGAACTALRQAAHNDIADHSVLCDLTAAPVQAEEIRPIPAERWSDLLLGRHIDAVRREAEDYLQGLACRQNVSRAALTAFYHDFSQVLYAQLERRGAAAHALFTEQGAAAAEHACDSIPAMTQWITQILTAYSEQLADADESGTVIEEIRTYVRAHLDEDIGRSALAQAVFLSPDYLSHLFREKMDTSLTAYITSERIRRAKELLAQNQLSIRDIALASGFQNISYFSKQFKKMTGQTPQEFRKGENA